MPATPAWPPRSLPRLFVGQPLAVGTSIGLDGGHANYLGNVLRLGVGAELLVFDGFSGEWLARIEEEGKKRMTLLVERLTRGAESIPDVWLAFAPIKRAQTDWLVEKSTELGVARLIPVTTQRTIAERVRIERLRMIVIEASEQCGRTRLPEIVQPMPLRRFVEELAPGRHFYFADEGGGEPAADAFRGGPAVILVGPEGGFTKEERAFIRQSGATAISLGPRILRAETAALASLAAFMAVAGDWRTY
ncbi:MAG TPA: 16S rRNA (uracil(1498)-N(3))-methyltransferase [Sphingomicrobium sp.]|nr:16S rRNA (uracil(1498)-N(3))-methyltransferase [Sphingomicrobium sp.]